MPDAVYLPPTKKKPPPQVNRFLRWWTTAPSVNEITYLPPAFERRVAELWAQGWRVVQYADKIVAYTPTGKMLKFEFKDDLQAWQMVIAAADALDRKHANVRRR